MEDALLKLEQQDELTWVRQFIEQPLEKRVQILEQHATVRWRQKLAYAQQRLKTEGWESACHSYALEVFGYARNRAPMLRLAARHPLVQMRKTLFEHRTLNSEHRILNTESEKKSFNADRLFDEESGNWKLNGLRPANHPRRRLAQYLEIVVKQPRWPGRLADCLQSFPVVLASNRTASFRKAVDLSELCRNLSESVFGSVISEKRFNTLIVDAILPLATNAGLLNGLDYWLHWFPGDSPEALYRFLKHAGVTSRQSPQSNSLIQGALGLFLDQQG